MDYKIEQIFKQMKKISYFLILFSILVFSGCNQHKKQALTFFEDGNTQMKLGNLIKAIIFYNKAIILDSSRVDYYMARANARLSVIDYKGSLQDFTKVIQLDPMKAEAYLSRGEIKIYMKEFTDEAAADLIKAIQLDDKLTNAYYNLGVVKYVQHDLETACINWKKAAQMGLTKAKVKVDTYCK